MRARRGVRIQLRPRRVDLLERLGLLRSEGRRIDQNQRRQPREADYQLDWHHRTARSSDSLPPSLTQGSPKDPHVHRPLSSILHPMRSAHQPPAAAYWLLVPAAC